MDTTLYLYNTLHRKKEIFEPINPPEVGFYSCGPTVYDYQHIGNMRAFLTADLIKRILTYNGYQVTHVMNITDVGHLASDADTGEDKIEKGARREGKTAWEIAEFYTDKYLEDCKALNIIPPDVQPRATEHIKDQIKLIQELEEKGYTYVIDDGVYFDTSKFPSYGALARLNLEDQEEGARVAVNPQKKNPSDFALWKFSPADKTREMEWESPWGKGFPGWHIECSAMSMKYLGKTFDIHSGGMDHIPVHHTNEIAQSEAATEKPFVKYWLHNEFLVTGDDEKMAKSKGTFITIDSLIKDGYDPLDYRFSILQTHYRSPMTFSLAMMDAAREGRARLNQFARLIYSIREKAVENTKDKYLRKKKEEFHAAINDDFNTPQALAVVFELVKDINSQISNDTLSVSPLSIWEWLLDVDKVLGLKLKQTAELAAEVPPEIEELLARRQAARSAKDWETSDKLRDKISSLGWVVEDTDEGQKAYKK